MLQIYPIPAFSDNYFWLIQPATSSPAAYIIDPGNAGLVINALEQHQLQLKGMLITHHHYDHIDGVEELRKRYSIPIYGPDSIKIPQITHKVTEGDTLQLENLSANVLLLPGHTRDHIGYYIQPDIGKPLLFSGDTIFAGGCGRLFDGSAEQLFKSLQHISQLPDNTLIYCAHEYTIANLRFARHIEPENEDLIARQSIEEQKRQQNIPTVPTVLLLEKQTNPFLRCHLPNIHHRVEQLSNKILTTDCEVFSQLRQLKNQF